MVKIYFCFLFFLIGAFQPLESAMAQAKLLKIAIPTPKFELDPHKLEDLYSMFVATQMHRSLFRILPDGQVKNDLADSWTRDSAGKKYEFKLKTSFFSDGTPIHSSHLAESIKRSFLLGASISSELSVIRGADLAIKKKNFSRLGIFTPDLQTLVIELERPFSLLPMILGLVDCSALKINKYDQIVNFLTPNLPVSGPYTFKTVETESIRLQRTKNLQNEFAPNEIEFHFVPADKAYESAKTGGTHSIDLYYVDKIQKAELLKMAWRPYATSLGSMTSLLINPEKIPLAARSYLTSALNSNKIVELISWQTIQPALGLIPEGLPGSILPNEVNLSASKEKNQDFKKAKAIFKTLPPLQLEFYFPSLLIQKAAEIIKSELAVAGIKVELKPIPIRDYFERLLSKKADLMISRKGIDYPDGFSNLAYFRSGIPGNYFHLEGKSFDKLLNNLFLIEEPSQRIEAYKLAQFEILKSHTVFPLFQGSESSGLWSGDVEFVPEHPLGLQFMHLSEIRLK